MTDYSDQLYFNASASLKKFFVDAASAGQPLEGVDVRHLAEFDPSRHYKKPFLLIAQRASKLTARGIDGGFVRDDFKGGLLVDTIHGRKVRFLFQLDLGTDTPADRERYAAVIDRLFEDAEDAGIPVYDFAADPNSSTELGRLEYVVEASLDHNFLPEIPKLRIFQDSIRFSPDYLHLFVKTADQPELTGVQLVPKEINLKEV